MAESPVFRFDGNDPAMQRAYEKTRATFRYFWREMSWERRRIVPALDLAAVKAPFSDGETGTHSRAGSGEDPQVEHMWMSEVDFDGETVSGVVINSPHWLTTVKEGDSASFPLEHISDWMYAIHGRVYGAFTVNLMRSRMPPKERAKHDEAWGLDFGDPENVQVVPADFADADEHPMSVNMGPSLEEFLTENLVGRPTFNALERRDAEHKVEEVGKRLRGMMSWIDTEF